MERRFDWKSFALIAGATLIGAVWAYYNLASTGGSRAESQFRALIWTIFATPFATFWGWFFARSRERWLAAFVSFCIYFFSVFVAARIESLIVDHEAAQAQGHTVYFHAVIVINLVAGLVVAVQRALRLPSEPVATDADQPLPVADTVRG
jgi:cytochrome bd-type quinol oxidase subunit 2